VTAPRKVYWKPALIAAVAALVVAMIGGGLTELGPWYRSLEKPSWQPPDWLFPVAWTAIYALAASSAVLAWRGAKSRTQEYRIIALFIANGVLNILWSALFFFLHRPDWALVEVGVLWLSIVVLIFVCAKASKLASWLLVPYLAWVSVAALLNYEVVRLNAPFTGS